MNINNNFTPLAWHQGNRELQSNRATYAFGHVVPLIASDTTFLPFQIIVATGDVNIGLVDIRLRTIDGVDAYGGNLFIHFKPVKVSFPEYDVIIYNGADLGIQLPIGQYYLELSVIGTTKIWYSDVVTIVSNVLTMTRIEWWDESDLVFPAGRIVYKYASGGQSVQYKNRMYFFEEIGMPEYTVEEEGDTRDGLFYASKVLSGKKYKMQVAQLTEAMCDALRFVHLSDNVTVRDGYGRMYYCDNVLITPEWQDGAVASASVEINTDTFVKQVGNGYTGSSPKIEGETSIIGQAEIGNTFVIGA